MEALRQYLIGVTTAAAVCAVVLILAGKKGSMAQMVRMIAGLFMAVAVLRPVLSLPLSDLKNFAVHISLDAEDAAGLGETMAREKMESVIIEKTTKYILEEASSLGMSPDVQVGLSELVPVRVTLTGPVSPYAKSALSYWIEENLGISREAQEWIE